MNAPELTKHAAVYMRGLRTIIDNMDDDTRMTRALRKIAYAHVKWNIYKKHIVVSILLQIYSLPFVWNQYFFESLKVDILIIALSSTALHH